MSASSAGTAVCTKGFGKMTGEDATAYKRLLDACAKKFEDAEGTLYPVHGGVLHA